MEFDSPLGLVAGIGGFIAGFAIANRAGLNIFMQMFTGVIAGGVGFYIGSKE